jgi:orotate phosphoribosyltransferase
VEGGFRAGETAVVVEDVITTAGQVVRSVRQMREIGLAVRDVVCAIDRQQGGAENLAQINCVLKPVFTMEELNRLSRSGA